MCKRECMLDEVHAASWVTCVGPCTCNLNEELSHDGGSSSFLPSTVWNHEFRLISVCLTQL
jgi:hypothetical protein